MKKELKRQGKAKIPGAPVPYDRTTIQPGIVHIGVGNFHRAHEEFYTNQLLGMGGRDEWGISGVALLPQDEPLYKALKSQDGLYTLTDALGSWRWSWMLVFLCELVMLAYALAGSRVRKEDLLEGTD